MDPPSSPDGGFYGWAPTGGSPRWPWLAWLFRCSSEPTRPSGSSGTVSGASVYRELHIQLRLAAAMGTAQPSGARRD